MYVHMWDGVRVGWGIGLKGKGVKVGVLSVGWVRVGWGGVRRFWSGMGSGDCTGSWLVAVRLKKGWRYGWVGLVKAPWLPPSCELLILSLIPTLLPTSTLLTTLLPYPTLHPYPILSLPLAYLFPLTPLHNPMHSTINLCTPPHPSLPKPHHPTLTPTPPHQQ